MKRLPSGRAGLGVVVGVVVAVMAGGIAYASIPDSGGAIHGCYLNKVGTLRVIDTSTQQCTRLETPIQWNQTGPKGDKGATGATGPAGTGLGGTVPSGQTLTGAMDIATTGTVLGTASTAVSFALPFSQGLAAEWVLPGVEGSANCPGPRSAPTAAPGHFCAYLTQLFGTTNNIVDPASSAPASMTTGTVGATLLAHTPASSNEVIASGVWAATAP